MKILIVDDEPLVRVGIKSSYDWEGNGYEIAGEAEDGEKALRMIEEVKPDIVILDIKMPRLDGLQVLEEIQQRKIETYVIVLSSFDDLDHVKKAMKLGAKDYFHKPTMNGTLIAEALKQFKVDQVKAGDSDNSATMANGALNELLNGSLDIEKGMLAVKERNLSVLLIKVKNYSQVIKRYQNDDRGFLKKSFMNLMKEIISKEKETELLDMNEEEYVLVISQSQSRSAQECQERISKLTAFMVNSIKRLMNIDIVVGVSDQVHAFRDVRQAYSQARTALQAAFYDSAKMVFFYQRENGNGEEQCLEDANAFISRLKGLLSQGSRNEFLEVLSKWHDFLKDTRCICDQDLKKIYKGFLFIMLDGEEEYFRTEREIDEMASFEELSAYFTKKADDENESAGNLSPITKNILNYIKVNYQQDISLKKLADEFNVSPNYVSKLFNKEMERGLLDYLNEIRVEKAKKLLNEYPYKIYEVAEMVGFNSQVHFNIVFHKYVGMSPKEYRKSSL
ncbi:response regulator [Mesobacillus jeotgali]|uniref:response regulator n=1 Tax=Mesobacillus jeotgali TaxID=129985 RepID=UPI00177FF768|nr:response regulator [Mesobacillus jeotgali]UYZ21781.1 response regulator [Mesobacillus jeotgali]